jgi:hypothetical protein
MASSCSNCRMQLRRTRTRRSWRPECVQALLQAAPDLPRRPPRQHHQPTGRPHRQSLRPHPRRSPCRNRDSKARVFQFATAGEAITAEKLRQALPCLWPGWSDRQYPAPRLSASGYRAHHRHSRVWPEPFSHFQPACANRCPFSGLRPRSGDGTIRLCFRQAQSTASTRPRSLPAFLIQTSRSPPNRLIAPNSSANRPGIAGQIRRLELQNREIVLEVYTGLVGNLRCAFGHQAPVRSINQHDAIGCSLPAKKPEIHGFDLCHRARSNRLQI